MKIAVVDDNKTEQEKISGYINDWTEKNCLNISLMKFSSGNAFLDSAEQEKSDIVFMDIIMDEINGIETAKRLRSDDPGALLIFLTSSTEFMAEAFPCHAFDYVIKPYDDNRILCVLDEAKRFLGEAGEYITIPSERRSIKLPLSDILYVYSSSNYCEIFSKHGVHKVRISFTELSRRLIPYPAFMTVNRGVIVNFDNTSHIIGFDCIMNNGDAVRVSRRKIKETEQAFIDRQFSKLLAEGK